jgi:hypothetical protein
MKVRTVFQPDVDVDVPDDEAEQLRRSGLLVIPAEPAAVPEPAAVQPAPVPAGESPDTTTEPEGSDTKKGKG